MQSGTPAGPAVDYVLERMSEYLEDDDDAPVLILALAALLLDAPVVGHPLLDQAREIIETGGGLERWREAGDEALDERLGVYRRVATRLP